MFKWALLSFFFLVSCNSQGEEPLFDTFERLGKEIAKKNNRLRLTVKGTSNPEIENGLNVGFACLINESVNVEEARVFLLEVFNFYSDYFNNHKASLEKLIHHYPISITDWEVSISFYYPSLQKVMDPELTNVWMMDGEIWYQTNEMGEHGHTQLKTLFTETYEEAVERAKNYKGPKPF